MNSTRSHGLAGKARRVKDLGRAHRLYVQQMLDEFADEEGFEPSVERFIPIRRNYEFLPSAGLDISVPEPVLDTQLELALPIPPTMEMLLDKPRDQAVEGPPPCHQAANLETPAPTTMRAGGASFPVLRPRVTLSPVDHVRPRRRKLTPGGFVLGCALGSAAAALVLLVLQLTVGF